MLGYEGARVSQDAPQRVPHLRLAAPEGVAFGRQIVVFMFHAFHRGELLLDPPLLLTRFLLLFLVFGEAFLSAVEVVAQFLDAFEEGLLTGHRVISTIHSGTAAGVFTRLLDMGIEPFLVASSVTGVLAQRLVRANCPTCLVPHAPDADLLTRFGIPSSHAPFLRGEGCGACHGIGYRGRTAIAELLRMNENLAELILARSRTRVLHDAALGAGMQSLHDDGLRKAEAGTTTLDELRRVLPPSDDPANAEGETP